MMRAAMLLALALLAALPARAHKLSDSYLTVGRTAQGLDIRWDIALRDLDQAIGLDGNHDGLLTWGEVVAGEPAIAGYALSRLDVAADGGRCAPGPVGHWLAEHGDGAYAVLTLSFTCPGNPDALSLTYRLLFDVDPQHRGLLSIAGGDGTGIVVLGPDNPTAQLGRAGTVAFGSFWWSGVMHMLEGADHLLFLAVLLLPLMFRQDGRAAFGEAAMTLTAFTLAHGLTLWLAVTGVVTLPAALVESAIALSIAITAADNISPFLKSRRWVLAFGFGLIHGLGFDGALGPLDLAPGPLVVALAAFNLGLESAQLGLAAIVLPLGYLAGRRPALQRAGLALGSILAGVMGLAWFAERAFGLDLAGLL